MSSTTRPTTGIHHVTAIASDPQANLDLYAGVLGLRLVKRTVNFDDPGSYHFYFGDTLGSPGSLLTFFPWPGARPGVVGAGQVTATAFGVPAGSLARWQRRLASLASINAEHITRDGPRGLSFRDHDGLVIELLEDPHAPHTPQAPGTTAIPGVNTLDPAIAIRRIMGVTITVRSHRDTADTFAALGMVPAQTVATRTRMTFANSSDGSFIDIIADESTPAGESGAGVVHHVALRATDDEHQNALRLALADRRLASTPVQERSYFRSIYSRERGGVLIEVATDAPGFAIDEPIESLGRGLCLPPGLERARAQIESSLPPVIVRTPTPEPA
jgi:glyoxalase family protein